VKRAPQEWSLHDQHILQGLARGDTALMGELYDRYAGLVYSLVLRIVRDPALAEELVQEVFLRVWRSAVDYRPELGSVRAWLVVIAHHCAVDEWRRRQKERNWTNLDAEELDWRLSKEDEQSDPFIKQALAQLPENQRQVIELAYFQGWTARQIANQLNLPPGTVKSRMRLALEKLRIIFGALEESG
jgi:RNA polymerase sigma-70 factor (ECF subfamily)